MTYLYLCRLLPRLICHIGSFHQARKASPGANTLAPASQADCLIGENFPPGSQNLARG